MSAQESNTSKRSSIRLIVLLGLLGVAIAALAYDRKVARPGAQAGYDKIMKLSAATNAQAGNTMMTNVDVQQALGKKPSKTETADGKTFEYFCWWGGFPGKSYDVIAEYGPGPDNALLLSAVYLQEIPPPVETVLSDDGEADEGAEDPAAAMGGGFAGPGPGGAELEGDAGPDGDAGPRRGGRRGGGETAPADAEAGEAEGNADAPGQAPAGETGEGEAKKSDEETKPAEKPQENAQQPAQDEKPPQTEPAEKAAGSQVEQKEAGDKSEAAASADTEK